MIEGQSLELDRGELPPTETPDPGPILSGPSPDVEACLWTAAVNILVRQGPAASLYPLIDVLIAGEWLAVLGETRDGIFFGAETDFGLTGYVPTDDRFGAAAGDCEDLPVLTPPPPPTATPTPTRCAAGIVCP